MGGGGFSKMQEKYSKNTRKIYAKNTRKMLQNIFKNPFKMLKKKKIIKKILLKNTTLAHENPDPHPHLQ